MELSDEFGDDIEFEGEGTPNVTGYFEVTVDGKLVHSKKNGDGFVDNQQKKNKIVKAIEEALK